MKLGSIDLSPFEYLIIYKKGEELNTWTLPEGSFQMNYKQMKKDKDIEIISVYKKLSTEEILDKTIDATVDKYIYRGYDGTTLIDFR